MVATQTEPPDELLAAVTEVEPRSRTTWNKEHVSRRHHSHSKPTAAAAAGAVNAKRQVDFVPILVGVIGLVVSFIVSMAFVVMQRLAAALVCPSGTVRSVEVTSSSSVNGRGTFHADLYCVQANGSALRPSFSPTLVVFLGLVMLVAIAVVAVVIVRRRRRWRGWN